MAKRKSFLVIGLGRFGVSLATALIDEGQEVLGVDIDPAVVQRLSGALTHVVTIDSADEESLAALGIGNFDAAIVAISGNFEASVLLTLGLKRLGARYVVAKANTEEQAEVLTRVGADRVVQPSRDVGLRTAHQLVSPNVLDYLALKSGMSVAEIHAPTFMAGKTLAELDVRRRYKITIILIKNGDRFLISPDPDDLIQASDRLVVVGRDEDIARLQV
jgi:trk system potassium uptake protein TrkA